MTAPIPIRRERYVTQRNDTKRFDTIRFDSIRYVTFRYDTIRHGLLAQDPTDRPATNTKRWVDRGPRAPRPARIEHLGQPEGRRGGRSAWPCR